MVWLLLLASGLWLRWLSLNVGPEAAWPSVSAAGLLGLFIAHVALGNWLLAFQRINVFLRLIITVALAALATLNAHQILPGPWTHQFWMWLVFGLTVLSGSWLAQAAMRLVKRNTQDTPPLQFGLLDAMLVMTCTAILLALPHHLPTTPEVVLGTWRFFVIPIGMSIGMNLRYARAANWIWSVAIVALAVTLQAAVSTLQREAWPEPMLIAAMVGTTGTTLLAGHAFAAWARGTRRPRTSSSLKLVS